MFSMMLTELSNPDNLSYTVTQTGVDIATVTINTATVTIDYIENQSGSFVVTVTADDNAGCNTTNDVFNVIVSDVNNPPITVTDSITLAEGGTATITSAGSSNVLSNDSDLDGDSFIAQFQSGPLYASSFFFKHQELSVMFTMVQKQLQTLLHIELLTQSLEIRLPLPFKLHR